MSVASMSELILNCRHTGSLEIIFTCSLVTFMAYVRETNEKKSVKRPTAQ